MGMYTEVHLRFELDNLPNSTEVENGLNWLLGDSDVEALPAHPLFEMDVFGLLNLEFISV